MSNTIILPDHISFEEIAAKWCDENYDEKTRFYNYNFITFDRYEDGINAAFVWRTLNDDEIEIADYYPSDRTILIHDEEKFQPILDYIKERSHGQN